MKRAIGIVRCSPDDLNPDKHSPEIQRQTIRRICKERDWQLLHIVDEVDVSGRWDLDRRTGLRPSVEAVERGEADLIVVARFDRLVRSVKVQAQITERVELAGGDLYAVDSGFLTNGNATERLSSGFLGLVAQYASDTARERSAEGVQRAIDAGIPPWRGATLGYLRPIIGQRQNGTSIHGPLIVDHQTSDHVADAWRLRAQGATVQRCQEFLAGRGIHTSYPGLVKHFKSRLVLGELHHGKFTPNLTAHTAIVDPDLHKQVQNMRVPSGRQAQSKRLLSRLGVLRCAGCDGLMCVGNGGKLKTGEPLRIYACGKDPGVCPERSTITADVADDVVWARAREAFKGIQGRAATDTQARRAAAAADKAEQQHLNLIAMLSGDEDVDATQAKLAKAKQKAKSLRTEANRLASTAGIVLVDVDDPNLSLAERRDVISLAIERAIVVTRAANGGRQGAGRIRVQPFVE